MERAVGRAEGGAAERCEGAALLQAVAVMFAGLALSDPAWLQVRVGGEQLVYGASYILHHGFNFTETGTHQLLHKPGLYILALIMFCCYINILIGSFAFMFDFVEMRCRTMMGIKISTVLHFIPVLSAAASVALCSYLYVLLCDEVSLQDIKSPANFVMLGDSFYFAICAFAASLFATLLSCFCTGGSRREYRRRNSSTWLESTTPLLQGSESPDTAGEYG
ncbi:transmembrane protein 127-like [Hyperolius riggenbachi]|uniref:transmembrane protein 127-like n=1 Tax=Hyperolius riggenbachi TaxID=752182 RepID=UPI0035A27B64